MSQSEPSDPSPYLNELFKQKSTADDEVSARGSEKAKNMWSIYEGEAKKYDGELSEAQKRDADSVLVFTGLFSAVVALFIVESYKKLSPEPGITTTILLSQISQQLTGFQNNTYPRPQETAPFSPTLAIIFVNALWFLSLVIAIVSAFYVMLVQQWIRRYAQTLAELTDTASGNQRVRSCLFIGSQKYKLSHAIGLIPLPLHISVFLFLSGLIIFLFTISNAIAIVLTVAVVLIGLAYVVLTILPIIDEVCPYFTPMSYVWWNLYHYILSAAVSGCYFVVERFRNYSGSDSDEEAGPGRLSDLSEFLKNTMKVIREHLKDGLHGNIFRYAKKNASANMDLITLTWLLQRPLMGDKSELQKFIHSIPPQILVQLSSLESESGKKTICDHLSNLFQDCLYNKDNLKEPERIQRLQICLEALYQIVKSSSLPDEEPAVLQYVWSDFKDLKTVRNLWNHSDPSIRIFSRSICAQLSRNILRKSKPDNSEQSWLRDFVGKTQADTIPGPSSPDPLLKWDHFILESFVFGVFPCLKDDIFVKPEQASCFVETLAVLMNPWNSGVLSKEIFSEEMFSFIEWAKDDVREHHDEVAAKLDQYFNKLFMKPTTNRAE